MTEKSIAEVLCKAYVSKIPVLIQANVLKNGNYYNDLECKVVGQSGGKIHLQLKDGRTASCYLEEIRNIEFMDSLDWYDKRK